MMMFLAEAEAATIHDYLTHMSFWPSEANFLTWCKNLDPASASLLIVGGIIFLFSGFKMHRMLITFTAAILGAYIAGGLSLRFGMLWIGLVVGAIVCGVLGWYLTALLAAAIGAGCGSLVGASIWNMAGLRPDFAWSGALTGAVTFGLLSFIIFRLSVIVFTCLQGSTMLVLGSLGMAYKYPSIVKSLDQVLEGKPMVLPIVLVGLALTGMLFQYIKGPAGASAAAAPSEKASASK